MFPSHYVVVVGYNKFQAKKLIVSNGFGNDFQAIDFNDEKIKPVRLIWTTLKGADGPSDGHEMRPENLAATVIFSWRMLGILQNN